LGTFVRDFHFLASEAMKRLAGLFGENAEMVIQLPAIVVRAVLRLWTLGPAVAWGPMWSTPCGRPELDLIALGMLAD
jgi:hypothetical protein